MKQKLEIFRASKSFSGVKALSDVSLTIKPGEIHALMGENGAGKSTFIKILAGVLKADSLDIKVDCKKVNLKTPEDSRLLGFRFIHQELNIVPQLSVAENIVLGLNYPKKFRLFINWSKLHEIAETALSNLGIDNISTHALCGDLSPGDQMLCRIASCLVNYGQTPPSLYVFDEASASLSTHETSRLFSAINNLKENGAAILYVSHRMNEVLEISDRVNVLRDGKGVLSISIQEASKEKIISAMVGRNLSNLINKSPLLAKGKPVLEVDRLCTDRLGPITFKLRKGEVLGIAGINNSGQSELLHALIGSRKMNSGEIKYLGDIYNPNSPEYAWKRNISYIPGERRKSAIMLKMSVKTNLLISHYKKLSRFGLFTDNDKETSEAMSLTKLVKLKFERLSQPIYQLSGGNQQKVVFGRALCGSPNLLLLDEPTRGVDVGAKFDIYQIIKNLVKDGCSVILSSTDLEELLSLCDRVLVMRKGRQCLILDNRNISSEDLLQSFHYKVSH
jgi:ribose transport system ATP-binding protein